MFGKEGGFGANLDLSALNGNNGFVINGINAFDNSGGSVSSAGDVNGDGFDDIIIGANNNAPGQTKSDANSSYVVFGKEGGFGASLNLSALNGSNGFTINGSDFSGFPVSNAGDVNGDGLDDIIIGAGSSYVVFGSKAGFAANFNLSTLNGSNGFVINGINAFDLSGASVSGAGDVNGDGLDDIIIGAPQADPNGQYNAGSSYVVFGASAEFGANLNLSALNGNNGFTINGINESDYSVANSGSSVSGAGDVNGDGFDDIIIGAPGAAPNGQYSVGSSYMVFGSSAGFGANLDLSTLNGSNGFVINGINSGDRSGSSVSGAGDVNSDGFDDILIGAPLADPNGQEEAGESYVLFGRADFTAAALNASTLEPFEPLLASNTGNAMMSSGQNLPFGSAADIHLL